MLNGSPRARGISRAGLLATTCLAVLGTIHITQRIAPKALAAPAPADGRRATRAAIDVMTRELRMAGYDPGSALPVAPGPCARGVKEGIVAATPTSIRFRQDLDRDGQIAASGGEDVTYELVGDTIRRSDGARGSVVLARGIAENGLTFRYFDAGTPPVELLPVGNPPALTACQRDSVAKVRIDVLAHVPNPDPRRPSSIAWLAESEVAIRTRSAAN